MVQLYNVCRFKFNISYFNYMDNMIIILIKKKRQYDNNLIIYSNIILRST